MDVKGQRPRNAKVLIVSKGLGEQGGVVNFVSMLVARFSENTLFEHMEIGRNSSTENGFKKIIILFSDSVRLIKRLRTGNFRSLHLNTSLNKKAIARDGTFLATASLFGFKKNIVFIHGWDADFEENIMRSWWKRRLFRYFFDRSEVLIVLASRFRDSLVSMGFEPAKIKVFSTMFEGDLFRSVDRERKPGGGRILFLSRLVREKGIFELLEAFRLLCERYREIILDIAGDGPERQAVADWVDSHDMKNKVRLLGYLRGEEKAKIFLQADIFVFPTRHGEGCPVALLEAMAAGLAVITTPVGGIPDIFTDGVNGILIQESQPATIAKAIAELLDNRERCGRIGGNNQREAWEKFEARIVTRRMEQLYREVASET